MQKLKYKLYGIVDFIECMGCQQCVNKCPRNAIFYLPSMKKVIINQTMCLGCGRCQKFCKFNAIKLFPKL